MVQKGQKYLGDDDDDDDDNNNNNNNKVKMEK
jgi:hypothetical protein